MRCASDCYRFLLDFKAALPLVQRLVALEQQLHGPRSVSHTKVLHGLCLVHMGLKAFPAARKAITEGRAGPATRQTVWDVAVDVGGYGP